MEHNNYLTLNITFLIHFHDLMSYLSVVKRCELYMELALYKIMIMIIIINITTHSLCNY